MRTSLAFLALSLAACGGGDVTLTATAIRDASAETGFTPTAPGERLVAVDVTLVNGTDRELPLTSETFRLDPSAGVSVRASALTAALLGSCLSSAGSVLAPDATASCAVAFVIPSGFRPATLVYTHEDVTAQAAVPGLLPDAGGADAGPPVIDAGPPELDAGPGDDAGRPDAGPAPPPTDRMDLLLVMDNSNSLVEEQVSFASALPRLMRQLTTGDADGDGDFFGDGEIDDPDFPPIVSLQVGVITPDMGTGGFRVPTCNNSSFGDDGVLRTTGNVAVTGCMATYPAFLAFQNDGGTSIGAFTDDVACVARTGTGGCGFEQQLEATLKALSPAVANSTVASFYAPPRFFMDSAGHGDGTNNGFVRDDSVLGVVLFTDEEDCSVRDPELFRDLTTVYPGDLNLRCFLHGDAALHPVQRYIDGLTQLRVHPSRLAYVVVAGVPPDLVPTGDAPIAWEPLISDDPARRDDRMEERIDPMFGNRLVPSCNEPGTGLAFPPIRMLQVGRELELNGAQVGIASICSSDFDPAVRALVRATGLAVRRL